MPAKAPAHKHKTAAVKATPGRLALVDGHPGAWQIATQGPARSEWWCLPWDAEAHASPHLFQGHLLAHLLDMDSARIGR